MLPARFVAENLGASVDWDGENLIKRSARLTDKIIRTLLYSYKKLTVSFNARIARAFPYAIGTIGILR